MKKKFYTILLAALIIIFVISSVLMVLSLLDDKENEEIYNNALDIALGNAKAEAEEIAPMPETIWVPEPLEVNGAVESLMKISLDNLRQHNEEVVGWIRIPGTKLDYPIMQTDNNEYYLDHAWDHTENGAGAIFLECRNSADFADHNTIVYGHNMRNGSMFATTRDFKNKKFMRNHPYLYILTDEGVFRYEIFAAYDAPMDSPTYGLSFNQEETKVELLNYIMENAKVKMDDIEPAVTDRILTLSTCINTSQNTRWVLIARLKMVEVPVSEVY